MMVNMILVILFLAIMMVVYAEGQNLPWIGFEKCVCLIDDKIEITGIGRRVAFDWQTYISIFEDAITTSGYDVLALQALT